MDNGRPLRVPAVRRDEDASPGIGWLVRAIRAGHWDPAVRHTGAFASRLRTQGLRCRPETVNKWEAASVELPPDRCAAYENALGLRSGSLLDVRCYLRRLRNNTEEGGPFPARQIEPVHIRLVSEVMTTGSLTPLDWLRIAGLFACRPETLTEDRRLRERVEAAFVDDLGSVFESEERMMLEAAAVMGDLMLPRLVERVGTSAPFLFNLVETLGHVPTVASARALGRSLPLLGDDFVSPNLVEAASRLARSAPGLLAEVRGVLPEVTAYSLEALRTEGLSYMAQEEAVSFLDSGAAVLSPKQRRLLGDGRPAHRHLRLTYPRAYLDALDSLVDTRLGREFRALDLHVKAPSDLDGLRALVTRALTAAARRDRLAVGVLLGPWEGRGTVAGTVSAVLVGGADHPVGVQRAAVRLLTKLQHPAARKPLLLAAEQPALSDEGLRFVLSWGLGAYPDDPRAARALKGLLSGAHATSTRRAFLVAATRQRNLTVLRTLADDPDGGVRTGALRALSALRTGGGGARVDAADGSSTTTP